jgi:tetratricopeptide (TPR) repeat protein
VSHSDENPSQQKLTSLLSSQQNAIQIGDAAAIAAATRPLIAYLLQEMSKLRLIEGKAVDAISLDRKSIEFVNSTETRLELASILLRTGQPKAASDETSTLLRTDPGNAAAWAISGSAFRSLGKEKEAVDAYSRSLAIKSDVNVAYALGASLLAIHEKEKAERVFRQIIEASGNAAIWHVATGDAYREAAYLTEAVEEFKKAVAIDPRVGHAEFFLGYTYLQMNEWGPNSQSFEHLRAAVRLAPRDYLSNFYLGAIESTDGSDIMSSNRHLHVASEVDPKSPEVWLYLGLNALRQKDTANAKTYLRKAIALTGDDEARNNYQIRRVYAILGRILIGEGNREEGDALLAKYKQSEQRSLGNSKGVIEAASHIEAMSPGVPLAHMGATVDSIVAAPPVPQHTSVESKQIADSVGQLSQLLASSYNDLGTAEARQGKYEEALAHFQDAEHWGVPTPALLHNIGLAAFRLQNFNESSRALSMYLAKEEKTTGASLQVDRSRMMLAMSYFSLGQFNEADNTFAQIPEATMQDSRAAYSWAYALAHSGQQQHANQIARALSKQTLPSDVLSLVCHISMDTEDYEQSVACFRKVYESDPSVKMAHYQVGESLIRLDRPAEAVSELRQELALTPDNPDVQYSLAFALLQSSHKPEAMEMLQSLTTVHPTHAEAQYQLGKTLLEQGNAADAVKHLEAAAKNNMGADYTHYQLQAAYRKLGRATDADRELSVYREIKARARDGASPKQESQGSKDRE